MLPVHPSGPRTLLLQLAGRIVGMPGNLLVLNSGSSSLKFALYDADPAQGSSEPELRLRGQITGLDAAPAFSVRDGGGRKVEDSKPAEADSGFGQQEALDFLMDWLEQQTQGQTLQAAGHRVVHGGAQFTGTVRVTDDVVDVNGSF